LFSDDVGMDLLVLTAILTLAGLPAIMLLVFGLVKIALR